MQINLQQLTQSPFDVLQHLSTSSTNVSTNYTNSTQALAAGTASLEGNSSMSTTATTTDADVQAIRIWTLFAVIGAFGIAGNALVALVLLRFTNLRRRLTNIYIINQSVIDCMASMFLLASTLYQDDSVPPGIAGELKCRLWMAKVRSAHLLYTENAPPNCTCNFASFFSTDRKLLLGFVSVRDVMHV